MGQTIIWLGRSHRGCSVQTHQGLFKDNKLRLFYSTLFYTEKAKWSSNGARVSRSLDLHGLAFLNTARGVNPIVQKRPFSLQEKWAYPPFGYVVDFVCQEASVKNDPSFNFVPHLDMVPGTAEIAWKPYRQREVSVHKTEIASKSTSSPTESSK